MNWLQGLVLGAGGVTIGFLIVRAIINHFRPRIILMWIGLMGIVGRKSLWLIEVIAGFIDHGLDMIRDKGDKATAKLLREMTLEGAEKTSLEMIAVAEKLPGIFKEQLYDGD